MERVLSGQGPCIPVIVTETGAFFMSSKWIEIARTGTFTDSAGRPQTFTERDLAAIAQHYDPQKRDAPLTFGHPASDKAPARAESCLPGSAMCRRRYGSWWRADIIATFPCRLCRIG